MVSDEIVCVYESKIGARKMFAKRFDTLCCQSHQCCFN
jgi:hypothetical protein